MKVLVTGAGGMLGRATVAHCGERGDEVAAFDRSRLDITDARAVARAFDEAKPETVINCAAWTNVDECETNEKRAFAANSFAVETLARASREHGACFVTVSTDYVFDGSKDGFYTQRDDPQPPSVYGKAKLDGERRAAAASARTIVVRTGWLYGAGGRNFLSVIAEQARRGVLPSAPLRAIGDAYGMPTCAEDLAERLRELAARDLPGTYHVVASGEGASYAEFARRAFALANLDDVSIEETAAAALVRPAPRPVNSRMRCLLSEAIGLAPLPEWRGALERFVRDESKGRH